MEAGKGSSEKRSGDLKEKGNTKKSKTSSADAKISWKLSELNSDGDEGSENSDCEDEGELIDDCYAYINDNPVCVQLYDADEEPILKVLEYREDNSVKVSKHTLSQPFDHCFIHNELDSVILVRAYNEDERDLDYDDFFVSEGLNFLTLDDDDEEFEETDLRQYYANDDTRNIINPRFHYRSSDETVILVMDQMYLVIPGENDDDDEDEDESDEENRYQNQLVIFEISLSSRRSSIFYIDDVLRNMIYLDAHYFIAVVTGEDKKTKIKSYLLGDGNQKHTEEITTYPFEEEENKVYKICLPENPKAKEIDMDSCVLNKGKEALIEKWGNDEGNFIANYEDKDNIFVLEKEKRLLILEETGLILKTGTNDRHIQFNDDLGFFDDGNVFPEKYLMTNAVSGDNTTLDIYDMSTMEKSASIPAPADNDSGSLKIKWNSDQSSLLVSYGKGNEAYIIKQTP